MFSSVQLLSHVQLFATPWTAARQVSLSFTNPWRLFKLMCIESMMPLNHLILCRIRLLLTSIFPSNRVFSNEYVLHISWLKYWSFNFSIGPFNKHSQLISFSIGLVGLALDWLDLLVVQWILKSLVQHHSSKASILHHSPFFIVQLSHPYTKTWKIIALIVLNFFSKVMSLLLKILSRFVIAFLQTRKHLLISWLQSSSAVLLESPQNKVSHCFHYFSVYLLWSDGTKCHDLHFLNAEL